MGSPLNCFYEGVERMRSKKIFAAFAAGVMLICSTGCSKNEESSSKFEYSSKDFLPFMVMINGKKIDLTSSSAEINRKLGGNFARGITTNSNVVLVEKDSKTDKNGVTTRTFACNKAEVNGSMFSLFNGLWANIDEASIESMAAPDSIKVKGSDGLSYYWSYYMDGEEIDYSEVNFDGTDTADTYMQYQLKGMAADDYCKKKLLDGQCTAYTGILFTTAEKQGCACEISVSTLNSEEDK